MTVALCMPCVDTGGFVALKFVTFIVFWLLNNIIILKHMAMNIDIANTEYLYQFLISHVIMCIIIYVVKYTFLLVLINIILFINIFKILN